MSAAARHLHVVPAPPAAAAPSLVVIAPADLEALVTRAVRAALRDMAPAPEAAPLLSVKDAAARLGVSPRTVQRWVKHGQIEHVALGSIVRVRLPGGSPSATVAP